MAKYSRSALIAQAQQIKNETSPEANTATRVGSMDENTIDSMVHKDDPSEFTSVDIHYADIPAMLGDQGNQTSKNIYWVNNAADAGISGYAFYERGTGASTGALSDYNYVGSGVLAPQSYVDLTDTTGIEPAEKSGRIFYANGSFNLYDEILGTSLQVCKEEVIDFYNNNGEAWNNFDVVISAGGNTGGVPRGIRALANTPDIGGYGVCTHDVPVGTVGKLTHFGLAGGNTLAWQADDQLYISDTVAGALTNVAPRYAYPVARVITRGGVSVGSIFVYPKGLVNRAAIGQASGSGESQSITTTPTELSVFSANKFELNTVVTQIAGTGTGLTARISPLGDGDAGLYEVNFSVAGSSTSNTAFLFELYEYDFDLTAWVPLGLLAAIDLNNSQTDAGSASFSGITQVAIENDDQLAVYAYTNGGTGTFNVASTIFNVKKVAVV